MKKIVIILWMFLSTAFLIAGGDVNSTLSVAVKIPKKVYKENKIYFEEDTLLMWQDEAYVDAEDGGYKRNYSLGKVGTWGHAMEYCYRLNYFGYRDWRLPTSDELIHVHRKEGQVFKYHRGDDFWSSTPSTVRKYYVVYPVDAYQYKRSRGELNYIRCVRFSHESERK